MTERLDFASRRTRCGFAFIVVPAPLAATSTAGRVFRPERADFVGSLWNGATKQMKSNRTVALLVSHAIYPFNIERP
jgi:hypothetical protein